MKRSIQTSIKAVSAITAFLLLPLFQAPSVPTALADEGHQHVPVVASQAETQPSWQKQLRDQLIREEAMEGRTGQREQVNAAMNKLMEEIAKGTDQHSGHASDTGPFKDVSMMQQMDRSFFLGPTGVGETVTAG